jgi:hypothetical protein
MSMARVTEALSAVIIDDAGRRPSYEAAARGLAFLPSDVGAGPLSGEAESTLANRYHERPRVDARAIRGIAVAVALSVPLWVAIVLGAEWVFG